MNINISNMGSLKSATIDVTGLTIVAGENNSGKTTLNRAIYAAYKSFYNYKEFIMDDKKAKLENILKKFIQYVRFDDDDDDDDDAHIHKIINMSTVIDEWLDNKKSLAVSDDYFNILKKGLLEFSSKITDQEFITLKQELNETQNINSTEIFTKRATRLFNNEFHNQVSDLNNPNLPSTISINLKKQEKSTFMIKHDIVQEIINPIVLKQKPIYIDEQSEYDYFNDDYRLGIGRRRRSYTYDDNHNRDYSDMLFNDKNSEDTYVDKVLESRRTHKYMTLLEKVVPGDVRSSDNPFSNEKKYVNDNVSLNTSNLSSGLKAFVSLKILIEKNVLQENSLLILDEPEIHLHPEWQILYAEIIVLLQQELHLHVICTTHSPYFLQAIQVYTQKYNTEDNTHFYLASTDGNNHNLIEDVSENVDRIYKLLSNPFLSLNTISRELEKKKDTRL